MRLLAICVGAFLATSAVAQDEAREPYTFPPELERTASSNPERFLQRMTKQLFKLAPDGRLTRADIDMRVLLELADQRARKIASVFKYDLDGDSTVEATELELLRENLVGNELAKLERLILSGDRNRDGAISNSEAIFWAHDDIVARRAEDHARERYERLMLFDVDGDGTVTTSEIGEALAMLGELSDSLPEAVSPTQPATNRVQPKCDLPQPSEDAQVVLIGGCEGSALSNIAVAGQDRVTSFATLYIEEGDAPLYVGVAVYDAMMIQLIGHTDRVEHLFATSLIGIGVTGLEPDRITFGSRMGCLVRFFHKLESPEAFQARGIFSTSIEDDVDKLIAAYDIGRVAVPSGHVSVEHETRPVTHKFPRTLHELLRYYPSGLKQIAPETVVVSEGIAEPFVVLPRQAGLLQLLETGALTRMNDEFYSIDREVPRFPAGLDGRHAVMFLLRKGVPMPLGSPGHSTVISEETGECVGVRCS